jgi:hypothetical protein
MANVGFFDENGGGPGVCLGKLPKRKKIAEVSAQTTGRDGETSMTAANDLAIRRTLETAGVEFSDENGGGARVQLKKPHQVAKTQVIQKAVVSGVSSEIF